MLGSWIKILLCSVLWQYVRKANSKSRFMYTSPMSFRYLVIISPWKIAWHLIWTNLKPLFPSMLRAKFEIDPVVLEKKMKMWKVYRQTVGRTYGQTTDYKQSEKLTWAFSSGELKMQLHSFWTISISFTIWYTI